MNTDFMAIYTMVGPAGCALALAALAGIFLILRTCIFLTVIWREFRRKLPELERSEPAGQCMAYEGDNPLICIIRDIVQTHAEHSEDIRAEVAYLFHRNFEKVTRDLCWIRLISVMSPMLGLLGTIFGMVSVFEAIGKNGGAPDAGMLATGIGEALMTTIMGLCVAIPALMAYYYLTLRFKGFHIEVVEYSYRALEFCGRRRGGSLYPEDGDA